MLEKRTINKLGNDCYLLGVNQDGEKEWLEKGKFQCDWYWGFGYVETFTYKYKDIKGFTHFDTLFFNSNKCCYEAFKEHYRECVLSDSEIWQLLELMKTLYTLRGYSDMLYTHGSHITENEQAELLDNTTEYDRINKVVIPALLNSVYELLSK